MQRTLVVALPLLLAVAAFGGHARGASADCTYGPQTGRISAQGSVTGIMLALDYDQLSESDWTQWQTYVATVRFTLTGRGGNSTVTPRPQSGARWTIMSVLATVPGPIAPGTYTVSAQWQIGCSDGTSESHNALPTSFTVARPALRRPTAAFDLRARASVQCPSDSPDQVVAEPYGVEVYMTTDGSLPTSRSRRYGFVHARGCLEGGPAPRSTVSTPARCVFVEVADASGVTVAVDRELVLYPASTVGGAGRRRSRRCSTHRPSCARSSWSARGGRSSERCACAGPTTGTSTLRPLTAVRARSAAGAAPDGQALSSSSASRLTSAA